MIGLPPVEALGTKSAPIDAVLNPPPYTDHSPTRYSHIHATAVGAQNAGRRNPALHLGFGNRQPLVLSGGPFPVACQRSTPTPGIGDPVYRPFHLASRAHSPGPRRDCPRRDVLPTVLDTNDEPSSVLIITGDSKPSSVHGEDPPGSIRLVGRQVRARDPWHGPPGWP